MELNLFIVGTVCSVVFGLLGYFGNRFFDKKDKAEEKVENALEEKLEKTSALCAQLNLTIVKFEVKLDMALKAVDKIPGMERDLDGLGRALRDLRGLIG